MSATSEVMHEALDLAKTQLQNYKKIVTESDPSDIPAPACAVGDAECINRWVQAFGDCS